jgi:hypothetical protein
MMDYCETYVLEHCHNLLLFSCEDNEHFGCYVKVTTDPSFCLSIEISHAINNAY